MRTTVRLDEELLKEAKRQAAESGTTLQAIIEESLRERLARGRGAQPARSAVRLKTAGAGGVLPGVDLDDSASLLDGFLRVVTHPRVFKRPSSFDDAMMFANQIRDQPNCVAIVPGTTHWRIFSRLCAEATARGNLVPDAYLAALAIELGCEWITTDRDFSRFDGLKWRHPLS